MLDFLVVALIATLFVLGLLGLVRLIFSFFPGSDSARLNPPVGKWWIILYGFQRLLVNLRELLNSGSPAEWTKDEYLNVFYMFASAFVIVYVWKSTTQPIQQSTRDQS